MFGGAIKFASELLTGFSGRLIVFMTLSTLIVGLGYISMNYIFQLGIRECVSRVVISKLEQGLKDVELRQKIINEVESLGADAITERLHKYHVPIEDGNK